MCACLSASAESFRPGTSRLLFLAADGHYEEADADAAATMPGMAIALEAGTGSKNVLLYGFFRDDTYTWTPGAFLYAGTTAGAITDTAPVGSGDQVQIIGIAYSADILFFSPDLTIIEV